MTKKPVPWLTCYPIVDAVAASGCFIQIDPVEKKDIRFVPRRLIAGFPQANVGKWLTLCQVMDSPEDADADGEPNTAAGLTHIGGTA